MFPNLFDIPILNEPLSSFFTLMILGFVAVALVTARWAKRVGYDHNTIIDLTLFALIVGTIGGRVLHVLADGYFMDYVNLCIDPAKVGWRITQGQCGNIEGAIWDGAASVCRPTETDCFAWAAFWRGGLAYYGGLAAGVIFGVYFLRREKFPIWKTADMLGGGIPLAHFFGRMGCFLGGCCFGQQHDGLFGLSFPEWSAASEAQWRAGELAAPHLASLPVHPTQLYEALGCLAIAALCLIVLWPKKRFDGQVGLIGLGLYALLRFALEFLRADDRGAFLGITTSQWVGIAIFILILWGWTELSKRKETIMGGDDDPPEGTVSTGGPLRTAAEG